MQVLPIDEHLDAIGRAVDSAGCAVVVAPPGAGKTLRVAPFLYQRLRAQGIDGSILVLEPRRLAARSSAARVAWEQQSPLGGLIGYEVRFDRKTSKQTRIRYLTEGIFLRQVQADPSLDGVSAVIFDEFHERHLDTDLAIGLARRVQQELRPDLKLLAMSATIDPGPVQQFLGNCPVIVAEGRAFPVEIRYLTKPISKPIDQRGPRQPEFLPALLDIVTQSIAHDPGDLLIFLAGIWEIQTVARAIDGQLAEHDEIDILTLFGEMSPEEQDEVLRPSERRKIVLATNVAETSVTIPGIRVVIDTGFSNQSYRDEARGINGIERRRISQASADQRAGRAGRTAPGVCYRLWTQADAIRLQPQTPPEITRLDLASAVLLLKCWGEHDVLAFPWITAPAALSVKSAEALLHELHALEDNRPTALGRAINEFPIHPRLARMILATELQVANSPTGLAKRVTEQACLLAAMLSERPVFGQPRSTTDRPSEAYRNLAVTDSDVIDRMLALEAVVGRNQDQQRNDFESSALGTINIARAYQIRDVARQLSQTLADLDLSGVIGSANSKAANSSRNERTLLRWALLQGFPDRVSVRLGQSRQALMVGNQGVELDPYSAVNTAPYFLAIELVDRRPRQLVRLASAIERSQLDQSLISTDDTVTFDESSQAVRSFRQTKYLDLVIESVPIPNSADTSAHVLAEAARRFYPHSLPFDHPDVARFVERVRFYQRHVPEHDLPSFADEAIKESLVDYCFGKRSFADLKKGDFLSHLTNRLSYQQQQLLEREVPDRFELPSGSRVKLDYSAENGKPILAARIQELFGMTTTPRIVSGRIPLVLHLLAPNYRPQQVTEDLVSFWNTTYQTVRKELRARYPKHPWPEDPWTAKAIRK